MHVRWAKGGEADIVVLENERISLRSTLSAAPGSLIDGALESGTAVRMKVARCKKQEDAFVIDGRLVDLTRKVRTELQALIAPG